MNILTVGASPYLLVRNGRIHSDVIRKLKSEGHTVSAAAWHHDEGYYLPDLDGNNVFEDPVTKEVICSLFPFMPTAKSSDAVLYEIMKKVHPDVVITVGDYKEVDFVYSIKTMYPNLFKWIAVFPFDCLWINEHHKDRIEYADYVVSTSSFGMDNLSSLCNVDCEFLPYGPDHAKFSFKTKPKNEKPVYMISSQNSQSSNIGSFIKAMALVGDSSVGKIHTNFYDPGDYDLEMLIQRYKASNVSLPDYFCSIKDGPSDEEFSELYRCSDFFVGASVKSATALTMLEAMAMGCVPIGMNSGRIGEIISKMPKEYQFFVPFETFLGSHEEEYSVISISGLAEKIMTSGKDLFEDRRKYEEASKAAQDIAKQFSNADFVDKFAIIVSKVAKSKSSIAVESF